MVKGMTSCRPPERSNESEIKSNESEMDLINRRDAIDAVNRAVTKEVAIWSLKELPSAQPDLSGYSDRLWKAAYERGKAEAQPDIIRCKDCRYYQDNNGGYPHMNCKWDANETPDEDDFCSGAERRTDGENISE